MNLATDPWIPVMRTDGKPDTVSLEQAFRDGENIRDLAVRPHERIALMRLFMAVAHAGLNGPRNHADWETCRDELSNAAVQHLGHHRMAFELFGESERFAQAARLKAVNDEKKLTAAAKLDLALATGSSTHTLFDNGGAGSRGLTHASLAISLITFQCFSPGSPSAAALWNGVETRSARGKPASGGKTYGSDAPCVLANMLHCLLLGENLLDTIWLNLIDRQTVEATYGANSWGDVLWKLMPGLPAQEEAVAKATKTFLGRLIPLSRAVHLEPNGLGVLMSNGLEYPAWDGDPAEASATVIVKDKKERGVFAARLDRAIWRDLPSLAAKHRSDGSRGALAWQRFPEDRPCDFWVGALVTDGKAKVLNTVESVFALPANASSDDFLNFYGGGVEFAQRWATAIEKGLSAYRLALGDDIGRVRKRASLMKHRAASHFWTAVEAAVRDVLIPLAANPPDELKCAGPFYLDYRRRESRWGPLVRRAAEDAFALACPQSSARQAAAYGAGRLAMLRNQPPAPKAESPETPNIPDTEPRTL